MSRPSSCPSSRSAARPHWVGPNTSAPTQTQPFHRPMPVSLAAATAGLCGLPQTAGAGPAPRCGSAHLSGTNASVRLAPSPMFSVSQRDTPAHCAPFPLPRWSPLPFGPFPWPQLPLAISERGSLLGCSGPTSVVWVAAPGPLGGQAMADMPARPQLPRGKPGLPAPCQPVPPPRLSPSLSPCSGPKET